MDARHGNTPFDLLGGEAGLLRLSEAFYARVAADETLRPLFGKSFRHEILKLSRFLVELCGGPGAYSERYGSPKMRARHAHVRIGQSERDAWARLMALALDDVAVPEPVRAALLATLEGIATELVNQDASGGGRAGTRRSIRR